MYGIFLNCLILFFVVKLLCCICIFIKLLVVDGLEFLSVFFFGILVWFDLVISLLNLNFGNCWFVNFNFIILVFSFFICLLEVIIMVFNVFSLFFSFVFLFLSLIFNIVLLWLLFVFCFVNFFFRIFMMFFKLLSFFL